MNQRCIFSGAQPIHIPSDKNVWFIIWFISMLGCSVTSTKLPIILTGTPTATECGGRSVMTRPPAPTWHPSPILIFPKTLDPAPSKTPSPTCCLESYCRVNKQVKPVWRKRTEVSFKGQSTQVDIGGNLLITHVLPLDAGRRLSFLILPASRGVILNNCDPDERFRQWRCLVGGNVEENCISLLDPIWYKH